MLWSNLKTPKREISVMNLHGHWVNGNKNDTSDRLTQSEHILSFAKLIKKPMILCGDFNLDLNTQSIKMLESKFRNLIRKYDVQSTRTSLCRHENKHADYVFLSPDIKVKDFRVMENEVSDHATLFLDFEI